MRSGDHSLEDYFNTNVSRSFFGRTFPRIGQRFGRTLALPSLSSPSTGQVELSLARDFIFTSNLVSMFVDELITLLTAVLMVSIQPTSRRSCKDNQTGLQIKNFCIVYSICLSFTGHQRTRFSRQRFGIGIAPHSSHNHWIWLFQLEQTPMPISLHTF